VRFSVIFDYQARGVVPDSNDFDHNDIRQQVLWGNIMVRPVIEIIVDRNRATIKHCAHLAVILDNCRQGELEWSITLDTATTTTT
jgi:hypothetical protein